MINNPYLLGQYVNYKGDIFLTTQTNDKTIRLYSPNQNKHNQSKVVNWSSVLPTRLRPARVTRNQHYIYTTKGMCLSVDTGLPVDGSEGIDVIAKEVGLIK